MVFKVKIFLDGELVEPSEYNKIIIVSSTIDRIVNDIYEANAEDAHTSGI